MTTPAEYAASEQAVKEFIAPGSVGDKLHNMLVEKGSKEENWVLNIYISLQGMPWQGLARPCAPCEPLKVVKYA